MYVATAPANLRKSFEGLSNEVRSALAADPLSGVIEGACRYLVKDRMDRTGARWSPTGAEAVLRLRAIRSLGDFDAYWRFHPPATRNATTPPATPRARSQPRASCGAHPRLRRGSRRRQSTRRPRQAIPCRSCRGRAAPLRSAACAESGRQSPRSRCRADVAPGQPRCPACGCSSNTPPKTKWRAAGLPEGGSPSTGWTPAYGGMRCRGNHFCGEQRCVRPMIITGPPKMASKRRLPGRVRISARTWARKAGFSRSITAMAHQRRPSLAKQPVQMPECRSRTRGDRRHTRQAPIRVGSVMGRHPSPLRGAARAARSFRRSGSSSSP